MKRVLLFVLLVCSVVGRRQLSKGTIVDGESGLPVPYATISFHKNTAQAYTDTNGIFYFDAEMVKHDTLHISHIGYKTLVLPVSNLMKQSVIRLEKTVKELEAVEVKVCQDPSVKKLNNFRRMTFHYGAAPGIWKPIIGIYPNTLQQPGYLHQLSYHIASYSSRLNIPLRLHWYEYDEINNKVGRELTDTNFIIYPEKRGWNTITLPRRLIYVDKMLVIGLEFVYPADMQKEYWTLPTDTEKRRKWTEKNILYIGMKKHEGEFLHGKIPRTSLALNFKILVCE